MSKILLVEDDNNLREIYEARLQAEGYDIVSARDGEEALTVAMKERPDLIISDVMMPKISGFDMLDIIRSTEETKNVKVIMMTALSQTEDKERAAKLGADRYLVKSQVTLEDVAKVAREVLLGDSDDTSSTPTATTTPTPPVVAQTPVATVPAPEPSATIPAVPDPAPVDNPATTTPIPTVVLTPAPTPVTVAVADSTVAPATSVDPVAPSEPVTQVADTSAPSDTSSPALAAITPAPVASIDEIIGDKSEASEQPAEVDEQSAIAAQIESFIEVKKTDSETLPEPTPPQTDSVTTETPSPVEEPAKEPAVTESTDDNNVPEDSVISAPVKDSTEVKKKIIQPISDPTASKSQDLENLLKKEVEKEQMTEIAKAFATEKADVVDELTAEAALRSAARSPKSPAEELNDDTPQVNITENGDLKVHAPPSVETPTDEQETAETPTVVPTVVPTVEQPTPIIPHSNGSSIDGVVQPETQPAPEQPITPTQPPKTGSDPEAIAL